jgi:uncharacterized membrane protein
MSFLVQWFYLLALALWVGGIVFFSFFTTPALFTELPKDMASQMITVLFPRYYTLGYVCGGIALLMTFIESLLMRQLPWIRLLVILIILGSTFYAGSIIRPEVHDLKIQLKSVEEGSELGIHLKARFDQMHRLSVTLNMIVLMGGILLLGIVAFRLRL